LTYKSFFDLKTTSDSKLVYRVRLARTVNDIRRAISIRPEKYAKHDPSHLIELIGAEKEDVSPASIVIIAEDISDNSILGTFRLEGNFVSPILEEEIPGLAKFIPIGRLVSISRLVVVSPYSRAEIKFALFKAAVKLCQALQVNWIIVSALPPMDRQFGAVLPFRHLMPNGHTFHRPDNTSAEFCLMGLDIANAENLMSKQDPLLAKYFFYDFTPEIEVFASLVSNFVKIRKSDFNGTSSSIESDSGPIFGSL
jgi:hypothetical protein